MLFIILLWTINTTRGISIDTRGERSRKSLVVTETNGETRTLIRGESNKILEKGIIIHVCGGGSA